MKQAARERQLDQARALIAQFEAAVQAEREKLFEQLQELSDTGNGLFWFQNVIKKAGGDYAAKTGDIAVLRDAVANPDAYYPTQPAPKARRSGGRRR